MNAAKCPRLVIESGFGGIRIVGSQVSAALVIFVATIAISLIGLFGFTLAALPFLGFALALAVSAWRFRDRRAMWAGT